MKLSIRKSNIEPYIALFLAIGLSNTVLLGIENRSITLICSLLLSVYMLLQLSIKRRRDNSSYNIFTFIIISILLFGQLFLIGQFGNSQIRNTYFGFFICSFLAFVIASKISKQIVCKAYVNIMLILSVISLVGFICALSFPQLVAIIPMKISPQGYYYTGLYTWGWKNFGWGLYLFSRNSGPFWEPGAFQGFILIALILTNCYPELFKKVDRVNVILIVTLLTTRSTTGLILLCAYFIVFRRELFTNILKNKTNRQIRLLFVFLAVVAVGTWLLSSGIITSKLAQYTDDTVSAGIRTKDFLQGIMLVRQSPLLGFGLGTSAASLLEDSFGISNNSNGLIYMMYTMGIPFGIIYLTFLYFGVKSFFKDMVGNRYLFIFLMFLILQSTECIFMFPVYLMFLYKFKDERLGKILWKLNSYREG